jgi:hypothetical protein
MESGQAEMDNDGTTQQQKEFLSKKGVDGDNPLPQKLLPPQDTNVLPPPSAGTFRNPLQEPQEAICHVPRILGALVRFTLGSLG